MRDVGHLPAALGWPPGAIVLNADDYARAWGSKAPSALAMGGMIWQRRPSLAALTVHGYPEAELWRALLLESGLLLGAGCLVGAAFGLYGQVLLSRALEAITGFPVFYSTAGLGALAILALVALVAVAASERLSRGNAHWRVREKSFAWERPLRRSDLEALGDAAPSGPILGVRVAHLGAKEALFADDPQVYFTTPYFDGYPAVLVRLPRIAPDELERLLVEAWLCRAPRRLAQAYLDGLR